MSKLVLVDNVYKVDKLWGGKLKINFKNYNTIIDDKNVIKELHISGNARIGKVISKSLETIKLNSKNLIPIDYVESDNLKNIFINTKKIDYRAYGEINFKTNSILESIVFNDEVIDLPKGFCLKKIKLDTKLTDDADFYLENDYEELKIYSYTSTQEYYYLKKKIKDSDLVDNSFSTTEKYKSYIIDEAPSNLKKIILKDKFYNFLFNGHNTDIETLEIDDLKNSNFSFNIYLKSLKNIVFNKNDKKTSIELNKVNGLYYIRSKGMIPVVFISSSDLYSELDIEINTDTNSIHKNYKLKKIKKEYIDNNYIHIPNIYNKIKLECENNNLDNKILDISSYKEEKLELSISNNSDIKYLSIMIPQKVNKALKINCGDNVEVNNIIIKCDKTNLLDDEIYVEIEKGIRLKYMISIDKYYVFEFVDKNDNIVNYIIDSNGLVTKYMGDIIYYDESVSKIEEIIKKKNDEENMIDKLVNVFDDTKLSQKEKYAKLKKIIKILDDYNYIDNNDKTLKLTNLIKKYK